MQKGGEVVNKWLRNKVVIGYIVIFVLLTLPIFVKVMQHYDTLAKIETALHQLYRDYCHEDVEIFEVKADIFQPYTIMPGGSVNEWRATTSSKVAPSVTGHYGKEVISIRKLPCSNYRFILDKGKKEFVPVESIILNVNDNEGIPISGFYFIMIAYFLYFSSIIIILLIKGIRIVFTKLRGH